MKMIPSALVLALDILFPADCEVCGRAVSIIDNGVCGGCMSEIHPPSNPCPRCSGVMDDGQCTVCADRAFYLDANYSLADYSGVMEKLLHALKFGKNRRLARPLAETLGVSFGEVVRRCDCIVPVPMNRNKKWRRGFNQSELIAAKLSGKFNVPLAKLLRENRRSGTQRMKRLRDRFINVLGRYRLTGGKAVRGKTVLLIDDVFTTGATINECARILKAGGAGAVYALTLARAKIKKLENDGS
ncbi:MAG TPA: ComF family protein [Spirochaetes bacterium]|nr:ComF family protein [Spirochaetota bacterium]